MTRLNKILSATALIVLVAAIGWQGSVYLDHRRDNDRREQAVVVARAQVIDLTTLDSATVEDKLVALKGRATGEFKRQLQGITSAFVETVNKGDVAAEGTIDASGIARYDRDTASVLVASTAVVTNTDQPKPTQRTYRMKVNLVWAKDKWLIDGMEFVP